MEEYLREEKGTAKYMREIMKNAYKLKSEDKQDGKEILPMELYIEKAKREYTNKTMSMPPIVGRSLDVLYGSNGTSAHKYATKLVMYSDTLARQMLFDKMMEAKTRENSGKVKVSERQEILNFVDQQFINYGYNVSGVQLWVEKIAGVQFLKYLFQHHKAYTKVIQLSPQRVLAQQAVQHGTGINVADPLDTLSSRTPLENLDVRWRLDDPIKAVEEAVTPNILMPLGAFDSDAWFKMYN
jgi:hypothetical protein